MSGSLMNKGLSLTEKLIGQSRYRVDVHECSHFLDVLRYSAVESLSQPWRYDVAVTCTSADIACDTLLLKPASFTFQTPVFGGTPALPVRTVFGVVESFRRVSTSNDEIHYALTIVPRIALLGYTKGSEIYLNQSVIEVVEQVLRKHGLEGPDFEFRLSREYPSRELITQWRETDLEFIQRLLAEVGIYWRYEMDSRLEQDVVIFQDSQQQYEFGVTLPLRNQAGMSDSGQESIWDIQTAYNVVSGSVATRDYNYRDALTPQDSAESIFSKEGITTGETYHYAEPFLTAGDADSPETGAYFARLRHERILNAQYRVSGHSSSPHLAQGPVLEMAPAINQINQANSQMQALNSAAEALVSDISTQVNLVRDRLKDLQSAVLLASAPQGVAFTSGEHLQLSSARNTMINAGQHLDIGAMKNLSVSVEKALGMFVHKGGAKVVANQGDVELQAQHNTMALFSEKQLTVTSSEDEIIISTPETLTLNGGGSYLRLSKNGIEHGSEGIMVMKVASYLVPGTGASQQMETPDFKTTDVTVTRKNSAKWTSE
ncbi:type VI secretion system tip protein VgrG [Salmonella enterica]|nr:type VI secretion system tip protein VgrG [Salmonella enterica]EBA5085473.1 type VI secretion system tip protein VgrG [Salmonella enterica]EDC3686082.1 type VI secretion system tip protein VgrG [Salmonella enterica]ELJ2158271.1 type VI secretion system tip protein VgrG [Salmonella enterica]